MRNKRSILVLAVALTLLAGVAALGLVGGFDRTRTERVSFPGDRVVRVALVDAVVGFDVTPDVIEAQPGARLVLDVVNDGDGAHDLAVRGGPRTRVLDPGESERLELGPLQGDLTAVCTLPGHELAGMTMALGVAR